MTTDNRPESFYSEIVALLREGKPFALGTVVHTSGSTPQKAGARAIFLPDGRVLGTLGGGWLFDRFGFRAVPRVLLWSIAVLLLFPLAAKSRWTVLPAVLAVGTMGALATVLQAHLMDVAREAQTLAAASNHSAFNFANALGPWLGGMAITAGHGWTSTGVVGALTAVGGLLVYAWVRQDARRPVLAGECE